MLEEIGITKAYEKPEDIPNTITVLTQDFITLITLGGSLCNPRATEHYKTKAEAIIKQIALRHHINYVGEIKD